MDTCPITRQQIQAARVSGYRLASCERDRAELAEQVKVVSNFCRAAGVPEDQVRSWWGDGPDERRGWCCQGQQR